MEKLPTAIWSTSSKFCPCPTCQAKTFTRPTQKKHWGFCITFFTPLPKIPHCVHFHRERTSLLTNSHLPYCKFLLPVVTFLTIIPEHAISTQESLLCTHFHLAPQPSQQYFTDASYWDPNGQQEISPASLLHSRAWVFSIQTITKDPKGPKRNKRQRVHLHQEKITYELQPSTMPPNTMPPNIYWLGCGSRTVMSTHIGMIPLYCSGVCASSDKTRLVSWCLT